MKLFIFSLLFGMNLFGATLAQQQKALVPALQADLKLFGITDAKVILAVKRDKDMGNCGCWGKTTFTESAAEITIVAVEDLGDGIAEKDRKEFQETIVQHEVMHIKLSMMGVPPQAQDTIILGLQPSLRKR